MSRQDLALEQKVLRAMKLLKHRPRHILLALSGGCDSMVMAEILYKWRRGLKLELAVAHVHHGLGASREQKVYRERTRAFVRNWAEAHGLPFYTNRITRKKLRGEQELREFRQGKLREWAAIAGANAVAFAHHEDDLLETRMMRLIRGSGSQGLQAMSSLRGGKLRPLLVLSQAEVRAYAALRALQWVEDPSNASTEILRNWMRREWLPSLEKQRPGALKSLARSLATVSPRPQEFDLAPYVGLRRELIIAGPTPKSRALVAGYLKSLGLKDYARTHVEEILKRLSSRHTHLAFEMLGLRFQISPDFLWASRV
jgi:tRNA(Ile)-lysidine synthase